MHLELFTKDTVNSQPTIRLKSLQLLLKNIWVQYVQHCEQDYQLSDQLVAALQVGDRGMKSLVNLTGLTSLNLAGCDKLSDACMPHLASMSQLKALNLMWCAGFSDQGHQPSGITQKGMSPLPQSTQVCESLPFRIFTFPAGSEADLSLCGALKDSATSTILQVHCLPQFCKLTDYLKLCFVIAINCSAILLRMEAATQPVFSVARQTLYRPQRLFPRIF
jgi:hypothetical protein